MDTFPSEQAEKDYKNIVKISFELEKDFKDLLQFVRNNYLEIDLDETSKNAIESYKRDMGAEWEKLQQIAPLQKARFPAMQTVKWSPKILAPYSIGRSYSISSPYQIGINRFEVNHE